MYILYLLGNGHHQIDQIRVAPTDTTLLMDANIVITLTIDSGLLVSDIELQIVAAMILIK